MKGHVFLYSVAMRLTFKFVGCAKHPFDMESVKHGPVIIYAIIVGEIQVSLIQAWSFCVMFFKELHEGHGFVCYGTVSSGNTGFYVYIHSIYYVLFTIRCQNYFFNVYSGKREEPF